MAAVGLAMAVVATASPALADDISNSIDAVAELMPLSVGGANGTTTLYVTPANGDGKNGCNLIGGTSLSLSLASSNTAVATVSPSSVTFTSCSDTKTLTVTPVSAGSASVTARQTANTTGGTFNLAPVTFTVNVTPPPNTPPSISVGGVVGGASYAKGSVPSATCQVTDAEDGPRSFPATLSAVSGPYASDGIGTQTASCSYTDRGGLNAQASETYGIVDPSAPVIGYTLDPAVPDGNAGWYRTDVDLRWSVTEPQSPSSLGKVGCDDAAVVTDGVSTHSCAASSAGGSAPAQHVTIKRDTVAPSVTFDKVVSGTLGADGWYTSEVVAEFRAADAGSGPSTASKTASSSGEGAAVTVTSPAFSDVAGNTASAGAADASFKIDLSDPTDVRFSGGPAAGTTAYFGFVTPAPTCTASDAVSGFDTCEVTGYSTAVGTHTMTATATDKAGRSASIERSYTVSRWDFRGFYQPIDMSTPSGIVYNTIKGGSTVPMKFELFAGATELTDTASINSLSAAKVGCVSSTPADDVEMTATGGTSLRYDTVGGQYVYNWQTPKTAGLCYAVTISSKDGSSRTAYFKTK